MTRYVGWIDIDRVGETSCGLPSFLTNLQENGTETLKTSPISDVYRVPWAGRDLVVKRYNHSDLLHSLRHRIKGSRARRGWINGRRLLGLGIPTPYPVACIDEYRGPLLWQSWLVTEYVDRPTLHAVLGDASVREGRKRRLIHQALKLIDRLGAQGITHGDMKHTNMLCDASRIVLTDLDGVEIHRLAWLHRQRRGRDIARFFRDVAPQREEGSSGSVSLELVRAGSSLRMNRDFRNRELEEALEAGPQVLAQRFGAEPIRSAATSRVCRFTAVFHGVRMGVYLKEYPDRSIWDRLKHVVRPSRATRSLRASQMLDKHGFCVPEVIAVGHIATRSRPVCIMATREIEEAVSVERYLRPNPAVPALCSLRERRELLRQLGRTIGRMHSRGIVHGDLRPGNVLTRRTTDGWTFFFIDNERTKRWWWLPNSLRLKNLVQINMLPHGVSRTDRLRFFLAYLYFNPSVCLHRRRWADRILTVTHRRFRKKGWVS